MGCRGVHFALVEEDVAALRSIEDEADRLEMVTDEIEERDCGGEWACETDKAWDAIHRSLTDGGLAWTNGTPPLSLVILGGELLYTGEDYILSLKTPEQVRAIAAAIASVSRERLRIGYDLIPEKAYGVPLTDADFEYTWEWFTGLVDFYRRAAEAGRHVLFTADQ